jgi:RND family efflux transporter MFP subunit
MFVELGQSIRRGAPVAEIYSPAIAELRAQYFNARADTDAGEARLRRTERLAALGSASQQDLEQVRAEHVRHETQVREAAARLKLLGIDAARLDDAHADAPSTVIVSAPQDGVVTERPVTAGATVDASTSLAIIADLSQVWVMADVYERDLARVAVGAPVSATSAAYPGVEWRGRVTYIAPAVRPETRTAQVRIEIANTDGRLKFGMFVDAAIGGIATPGLTIPASAVQTMGEQSIVFVPVAAGVFRPRRVKLGPPSGDRVAVLDGLAPGESVVTAGSFAVRAEAERQGVRLQASQAADVAITASGFEPASLHLQPGVPARVTFTRKTDQTCATDVAIPAYGIKRPLPLNQPVTVEFVPAAGDAAFQCGMGMLTGTLVVR